ncbi:hypothetical protein FJ948_22440 [Mesorhizobium sp. B2-3-12]|nr:hypothetical protein [Mesorhizobium sp. B2-3-12]TPL87247.1 hypothetical protein FJ948_22440 [Mesorhizobium sp. B2-3-12]
MHRDAYTPSELAVLSRVLARSNLKNETETERERRASRILAYYQAGITDENELEQLSRQPLGR